ncbi:DUF4272 domain-containing protein [Vreelandella alkaliphila]|uniref:DUF4272 domain-containing protein n=1 Tax=Vreelandella alkaliphila TaxID=272774 RepID=A0A7C9NPS1_9GAMM|nr:DUF4272 domain-containing protein [Halomonas alkaliphila]NDL72229.1 DUF4272 domain-containing protein [Halomonas alkaliphila]
MAKSPSEVAGRVLALFAIAHAAHERPPAQVRSWLERYGVSHFLSRLEASFLSRDEVAEQELVSASWRTEALPVLTWAIGLIEALPPISEKMSLDHVGITRELLEDPESFVASAELRPRNELEAAQAEIESQHWGVRAGPAGRRMFNHPSSEEDLDPGVVYERHYAANWLVFDEYTDWDLVETDT